MLATILAGGLAYLPYQLLEGPQNQRAGKLESELADTRRAIDELRLDNEKYRREIDALKNNPQAIEDIARDELGLVHPDEVVIRVISDDASPQPRGGE